MALGIKTSQKALGAHIISCAGRLDTTTSPMLEKEVDRLLGESPQLIAFDMEDLNYMSSAGVRVLIKTLKAMKENGGKVVLLRLPPQIKKVLEIINALPEQRIFKDIEELDGYLDRMQKKVLQEDE